MTAKFFATEHKLQALHEIDPITLEFEDRIHFYKEMVDTLTDKIKEQLLQFQYKSALVTEAIRKDYQNRLATCYTMLSDTQIEAFEKQDPEVFYVKNSATSRYIRITVEAIKSQVRTLLFGLPFDLKYDGEGLYIIVITASIPGVDTSLEFSKLKDYAKDNDFKLLDKDKKKLEEKSFNKENMVYLQLNLGEVELADK